MNSASLGTDCAWQTVSSPQGPTTTLDCTWPKGGVGTLPKGIPVCSLELDNNCPGLQEGAVLGVCLGVQALWGVRAFRVHSATEGQTLEVGKCPALFSWCPLPHMPSALLPPAPRMPQALLL